MYELKKMGSCLRVNLLGPGPRLMEKRIYRAAVSQRLRKNGIEHNIKTDFFILILFLFFKILIILNYK